MRLFQQRLHIVPTKKQSAETSALVWADGDCSGVRGYRTMISSLGRICAITGDIEDSAFDGNICRVLG